jgi:sterol desaturase/sphingolipid hydroxylase (fatty acid hydroxylase superfamily)
VKSNHIKQVLFFTITPFCLLLYVFLGELSSLIYKLFSLNPLISLSQLALINENLYFVFLKAPLLHLGGFFFCFVIEALIVGWNSSSLKEISCFSTASARTDIFYVWMRISGLTDTLFNIIFFSFGFYFLSIIEDYSLMKLNNYFLEFILALLSVTFFAYVYHRITHHKIFWELHKLHHSANKMSIFTASREHPLIVAVSNILTAIPTALLGVRAEVLFVYFGFQGVYNMFLHSKVDPFPSWATFMITTNDHYIHHSTNPKHYSKNYGMVLSIWDKIFGTYYEPEKNKIIQFGIKDENYNRDYYFKEIVFVFRRWLKQLLPVRR